MLDSASECQVPIFEAEERGEEAEAKSSMPECVEVKVHELQSEMTRYAQSQGFIEAGDVKTRVRICLYVFCCVVLDFYSWRAMLVADGIAAKTG